MCKMPLKMRLPLIILLNFTQICLLYGCDNGSCHPATGDLLVGRSEKLMASSTCGLFVPQRYCILGYLEDEQKCFTCDSRHPNHPAFQTNSHVIENIIVAFEPNRKKWWQSENGIDHVTLRLDLETLFQFSHLILTFKTFRPAAMLVERSTDYGQTWKVFRYFARDCAASFPNIPSRPARVAGDVVCDSRYSDIEPSTEGQVVFKALDPIFEIANPYVPYIQDLTTFTNLRINFTKLHTLGDTLLGQMHQDPLEKYYYALYEMVVRGSCFCNGHASRCAPMQKLQGVAYEPGMVHGRCVCEHNTAGLSCERCREFYHNAPWMPAEGSQENACERCECNGHSERCHLDMAVYLANHHRSGGVCDECQHNTAGQHCDQCKLFFYQDPRRTISDPQACIPCDCDPQGTMYNGLCESHTDTVRGTVAGQCHCKENVEGVRCDKCKPNYYGLNESNPYGCQPCDCNPSGSLSFALCDPMTGQCLCQQFATGKHCDECIPGYWGLESNLFGCSPCDCDIGGARSNLCAPNTGKCECLPHVVGQRCAEPAPGYFFLPLDYYIYEAEVAKSLRGSSPLVQPTTLPPCDVYFRQQGYDFTIENGKIVLSKSRHHGIRKTTVGQGSSLLGKNSALDIVIREPVAGKPVTWSGPGGVRVLNGAGLRFIIRNIPFLMESNLIIRYEPESFEDWIASITVKPSGAVGSERCKNKATLQEPHLLALPSTSRIQLLPTPVCLEPGTEYFVDVYFSISSASDAKAPILIDSLGLIPRISSVKNLCNEKDLEAYRQYRCIEIASEIGPHILPEVCAKLIASLSARIHNGAVPCKCHPQGSVSSDCKKLGGQCRCKPNVVGQRCDKCSAGSHSFGSHGCHPCECHPQGSTSTLCDQETGQCSCRAETGGRRCSQCLAGYFGFPYCRPCLCNGFAERCDPQTSMCVNCRSFTTGANCERCRDGYYGNPLKREPCRPCMCPDVPTSARYFAHSCYQDPWTLLQVCNCFVGYAGDRCDECPSGFYGDPKAAVTQCLPCACNNNIDVADPESCNKITGRCLKCLYNTHGPNCEFCKPGYFGSAPLQNCKKCDCNPLGVKAAQCLSGNDICTCDQTTGRCPCLPNVTGIKCDQCVAGYWNMIQEAGCRLCDCDPKGSQNNLCNQFTGQCPCKLGYTGRHCDICDENYFGDPRTHCVSCQCHEDGTLRPKCDKDTGLCNCRAGVSGKSCDQCARGFNPEFPSCFRCHVCFDQWDNMMTSLSQRIQKLMKLAAKLEDERNTMLGCDTDFEDYMHTISEIEAILKSPVLSSEMFWNIKNDHDDIRQNVSQINLQLNSVDLQFPNFSKRIEDIRNEAQKLYGTLQKRIELHKINDITLQDVLNNVRNDYQTTLSAENRVNGSQHLTASAGKTRGRILALLDDLASKESNILDQLKMFQTSDIQKLNEKICGKPGNLPCVVAACGGSLCQDHKGSKHCGGPNCGGALPLFTRAIGQAHQTAILLHNLTRQMQDSGNKVESIRKTTENTKNKASRINEEMEKSKNQIEKEAENTRLLIHRVKNFLLEESGPPEDIEKVANYVLDISLPMTPQELTNVLDKMKNLIKQCVDSTAYLYKLNKQEKEAKDLSVKAQESEELAKGLLPPDVLINHLGEVESIQGQTRTNFVKLDGTIQDTKTKILQAGKQLNKSDAELRDFSEKQSELEGKITSLKNKTQRNRNQTALAKSEAERAQHQAMETNKEYTNLKKQYVNLQEKLKAKDIPLEILEKLTKMKKEAVKLAKESEGKMKRIADLAEKIQDLNQIKKNKAEQLKHLEDQVIAIKNEMVKQSNKHANCKS